MTNSDQSKAEGLDGLIEFVKFGAKQIIDSGQEHASMLFVVDNSDRMTVGLVPLGSVKEKSMFKMLLPDILRKQNAVYYVYINEAWETSSSRPLEEGIGVVDLPLDDRVEIVLLVGGERGKTPRFVEAKIRTVNDKRTLEDWYERKTSFSDFGISEW